MNRTPPIISAAWSPSNVELTMWRQLLFELKHFCCVVKTMNNSLYTPYVGVGSRAAGRSTILRLRSKARQSLEWTTHTSSGGGNVCVRKSAASPPNPSPQPHHKAKNGIRARVFVWVKEWGCLHVRSERVCVQPSEMTSAYASSTLFAGVCHGGRSRRCI